MFYPKSLTKLVLLCFISAMVVACGTKVPLNEAAKVEDRVVQPVGLDTKGANGAAGVQSRDVKAVDVSTLGVDAAGNTVYFDFDSYVVKPQFQNLLQGQAKRLKASQTAKMTLSGHTDESGGREYNLALGQKRAEAVKRSLSILGVAEVQMEAVSYGKEKPVVMGGGDVAGEKNRRVEITIR